jgi:hypothetical protein
LLAVTMIVRVRVPSWGLYRFRFPIRFAIYTWSILSCYPITSPFHSYVPTCQSSVVVYSHQTRQYRRRTNREREENLQVQLVRRVTVSNRSPRASIRPSVYRFVPRESWFHPRTETNRHKGSIPTRKRT